MANRKINVCTSHVVSLCPENKVSVGIVKAEIEMKHQSNISEAINKIIEEWRELKKKAA